MMSRLSLDEVQIQSSCRLDEIKIRCEWSQNKFRWVSTVDQTVVLKIFDQKNSGTINVGLNKMTSC